MTRCISGAYFGKNLGKCSLAKFIALSLPWLSSSLMNYQIRFIGKKVTFCW